MRVRTLFRTRFLFPKSYETQKKVDWYLGGHDFLTVSKPRCPPTQTTNNNQRKKP